MTITHNNPAVVVSMNLKQLSPQDHALALFLLNDNNWPAQEANGYNRARLIEALAERIEKQTSHAYAKAHAAKMERVAAKAEAAKLKRDAKTARRKKSQKSAKLPLGLEMSSQRGAAYAAQLEYEHEAFKKQLARKMRPHVAKPARPAEQANGEFLNILDLFNKANALKQGASVSILEGSSGVTLHIRQSVQNGGVSFRRTRGDRALGAGRISATGVYTPGAGVTEETLTALRAFAVDPARAAAEYGFLVGRCSFCDAALTQARSIAVGYGPVCAKKWNLHYPTEAEARASRWRPAEAC